LLSCGHVIQTWIVPININIQHVRYQRTYFTLFNSLKKTLKMASKTPEDKKHDARMLLFTFLLTTVLGGALTFIFQTYENRRSENASERLEESKLIEQRRQDASKLYDEISPLMDTRLYEWRQVAWALEDKVPDKELNRRYEEYRKSLLKWVHSLNRNRALVCRYFGPAAGLQFEAEIMPEFIQLQNKIRPLIKMHRDRRPSFGEDSLNLLGNNLGHKIYMFNNMLAEAIRSGNVALTDSNSSCDFSRQAEAYKKQLGSN
jgi:hypothetical protein